MFILTGLNSEQKKVCYHGGRQHSNSRPFFLLCFILRLLLKCCQVLQSVGDHYIVIIRRMISHLVDCAGKAFSRITVEFLPDSLFECDQQTFSLLRQNDFVFF
jgi:hypothetical protein